MHFKIADNVYVNDVLVLPKGALGEGTIKKVVQPRSFGRDARIDVDFTHVYALDGTKVNRRLRLQPVQQERQSAV